MKVTNAMRLISLALIVIAAFAAPSVASAANWKENGTEVTDFGPHWLKNGGSVTSSTNLTLEGTYNFTSAIGGINCSATAGATINPGASGSLSSLSLSGCKGTAGLQGCTVTSATSPGIPDFRASAGNVVQIVGGGATYKTTGLFCPKELTVTGTITATPDNNAKMSSLALSGEIAMGIDGKPISGKATMNGTLAVKPAATYGIGAAPTVALKGELSNSSPLGGIQCAAEGSLRLQAAGAGQITAFNLGCVKTGPGGWFAGCGNITSTSVNSLPWAVQNEGTSVKISGVSFIVHMQTCNANVSGALTATPDNASAISNVNLTGVLNTGGQNTTWNGGLSWTPAGWYGL